MLMKCTRTRCSVNGGEPHRARSDRRPQSDWVGRVTGYPKRLCSASPRRATAVLEYVTVVIPFSKVPTATPVSTAQAGVTPEQAAAAFSTSNGSHTNC